MLEKPGKIVININTVVKEKGKIEEKMVRGYRRWQKNTRNKSLEIEMQN